MKLYYIKDNLENEYYIVTSDLDIIIKEFKGKYKNEIKEIRLISQNVFVER